QNMLAWLTLFLFFMIPLIAFVTWGIRRLVGARSKKHYVGITFLGLWIIGLISGISLAAMIARNFKNNTSLKEEQVMVATKDRLFVDVEGPEWKKYNHHFFGMDVDGDDFPFYDINDDSIFINTVKLSMVKSLDSSFHVYRIRSSRGSAPSRAEKSAQNIDFNIQQRDSVIVLPRGFNISRGDKFRNQRVWIVIEVPVGKKIAFSEKIRNYNWFSVKSRSNGFEVTGDEFDDRENLYRAIPGNEYVMRPEGRPEKIND
ncbi:MAG: hypothetical protein H0X41_08555, partial [Chitinophagaceae bacterium]|nr:hypothetical protein [Chitinophagaceae bacterium]